VALVAAIKPDSVTREEPSHQRGKRCQARSEKKMGMMQDTGLDLLSWTSSKNRLFAWQWLKALSETHVFGFFGDTLVKDLDTFVNFLLGDHKRWCQFKRLPHQFDDQPLMLCPLN
jgi:hypothetical protein